jgi:hypothetical protein
MSYTTYLRLGVLTLCLVCAACKNPDQKLESEKQKAGTNIRKAEQNVDKTREDVRTRIQNAQGPAVDKAKIEATEEIAEAKRKVEDEKVKATEDVTDAEQKAKVEPSPELP